MNLTESTPDGGRVIQGVPRIDRYFPACQIGACEAISRFKFGLKDFSRIYGKHSFAYTPPPSQPIPRRPDSDDLDINIHRTPLDAADMNRRLLDIYGVAADMLEFVTFPEYWQAFTDSIANGLPLISDFDLRFLQGSREYRRASNHHVIILTGYRPNVVVAAEQVRGTVLVGAHDFRDCFEHVLRTLGAVALWKVRRVRNTMRELQRDQVLCDIHANIRNLSSGNERSGLNALRLFIEDLERYLQSDSFQSRPFSIPGMWVFSHERHLLGKWLTQLGHLYPPHAAERLSEFQQLLDGLFDAWLHADVLIEKCLASGRGEELRQLPEHFGSILAREEQALGFWSWLRDTIAACH